jgi:hypothetical protein
MGVVLMSEQTALPMAARITRREALAAAGVALGSSVAPRALADESTTQPAPAVEPAGSWNDLFDDANHYFGAGWGWRSD